ncbi:MAG: TrkH family potassium uptake protein [Blautia sp.]|nr:TrkH family potassium uptake protein [Blautia sp.]
MNYKMLGKLISQILFVEAILMLPSVLLGIIDKDRKTTMGFLVSIGILILTAGILYAVCRNAGKRFYAKDGLVTVALSWIVMSIIGCLPFCISGAIPNYIDALFEIVSGFTTTGASIMPAVEDASRGVIYWRSFSHWIGGMGVLVLLLAVSSIGDKSKGFTMHLLRAESPGPDVGKLVPRMKKTANILYMMYLVLTLLDIIFLLAGGMPLFDSLCTAFGTAGTGGFGIKNDSMAGYSPYIQNVCTIFMFLFGVNFSCYYLIILKRIKAVFLDEELRFYIIAAVGSTVLIVWDLRGFYGSLGETIRHAAFQVSSIMTTTGFATTDFDLWPSFSKSILLCLMVIGACAGSTGGGMKCGRILLLLKGLRRNIRQILHPEKVQVVRNNGKTVDEKILANTNAYLAAYVVILIISFCVISLDGFGITTNLSAVLACFNNIGPGLEAVGPTCNFSSYSVLSKLVLIGDMLAGRLEIFPMLILLSRSTWSRR